jgi:hypothetical protein
VEASACTTFGLPPTLNKNQKMKKTELKKI